MAWKKESNERDAPEGLRPASWARGEGAKALPVWRPGVELVQARTWDNVTLDTPSQARPKKGAPEAPMPGLRILGSPGPGSPPSPLRKHVDQNDEAELDGATNGETSAREQHDRRDIRVLLGNPLLATLRDMEIARLFAIGEWLAFRSQEVVAQEATPIRAVLFISQGKGKVELSATRDASVRIVLKLVGPGDAIGALSLLDNGPHPATVTALEDLRGISIATPVLREFLRAHREWSQILALAALDDIRFASNWLKTLVSE